MIATQTLQIGSPEEEPEVMTEINTTPLIDVMLVLLIMLIITIPIQLHAVNMDMPRPALTPVKTEPSVVKIEIDAQNTITWNGQPLPDRATLEQRLQEAAQLNPQPELHIRGHAKAKYEHIAKVLASAQKAGLNKLGILGVESFAN